MFINSAVGAVTLLLYSVSAASLVQRESATGAAIKTLNNTECQAQYCANYSYKDPVSNFKYYKTTKY